MRRVDRSIVSKTAFTELSQPIAHRFSGKGYQIASLPKGMEIVGEELVLNEKVPTVAVVDAFTQLGRYKIAPGIKVPHGEIVTKYAVNGLEKEVGVLAFDATPPDSKASEWDSLREALEDLVKIQRRHHNIKVLNLSVGFSCDYETFNSRYSNVNATVPTDKNQLMAEAEAFFERQTYRKKFVAARESIKAVNRLVKLGVMVYLASGNDSDKEFDLLSLSEAQHIVTAHDYEEANRQFATRHADANHTFRKFFDEEGNLLKVTDGIIEFTSEEVPMEARKERLRDLILKKYTINGTSFSCPLVLNEDLKDVLRLDKFATYLLHG